MGGCPPSSPSFSSLRRQHKWIAWTSACAAVASKLSRSKLATEYSEWGVVALGVAMGSSLGEILTKGSVVLSCDSSPSLPWLADWDEAGYYPRYFEHVGMRNFHVPVSWGWFTSLRWEVFTWIATGWRWYGKENAMLHEVRRKAGRFPAARRFNIEAGVTPSVRAIED